MTHPTTHMSPLDSLAPTFHSVSATDSVAKTQPALTFLTWISWEAQKSLLAFWSVIWGIFSLVDTPCCLSKHLGNFWGVLPW